MTPERVLRTFAALSQGAPERRHDVVHDARLFQRQRYTALRAFSGETTSVSPYPPSPASGRLSGTDNRLLSTAALHKNEQLLRMGWLWFAGTVEHDGKKRRYCFPALSVPVERAPLRSALGINTVRPIGDVYMTDLIESPDVSDELFEAREFGGGALVDYVATETGEYLPVDPRLLPRLTRLMTWARRIASELDLRIEEMFTVHEASPVDRRSSPGIALHVCAAMYVDQPAAVGTRRESLLSLAGLPKLDETAFARMYRSGGAVQPEPEDVHALRPLSSRQRQIASQIVSEPLSVVSGAPGTGKSHVLTVAALDAVSKGKSVLVAASSAHAVDVLVEHFARTPGPTPVAFGGSVHGNKLATELASLVSSQSRQAVSSRVAEEHHELLESAEWMLELEQIARRMDSDPARRIRASRELAQAGDLVELERMLRATEKGGLSGWRARRRYGDALDLRLGETGRRGRLTELRRLAESQSLLSGGGLTLTSTFDEIVRTEDAAAGQRGAQVTADWLGNISYLQRRSLVQISTALTSSRSQRRRMLTRIDPADLVAAAPLWVGSVRDVDDVLPAVAGMFDLVILDEASQIDQMNAANALVRGKHAIICGDPEQLGHVSFVSDADIETAAAAHQTDPEMLNPRRRSTFDVAMARAPVQMLDEHFRSVPHLIGFSARKIYDRRLHIASRHPANESADRIDVHHVVGERGSDKVNRAEVNEAVRLANELIANGWRGIGFISPFRAQAEAIEEQILETFRLDEIDAYGLRVGTVHSFQGDERQVMIASLAVGEREGSGAWRFVNQRNLFNVMVTRARERMIVITSTPKPPGLAGEYVRWADPPGPGVLDEDVTDPWARRVAGAVADTGLPVRLGYRTGRHLIDVVVGEGEHALAVDCSPHIDGPAAHIDRALQLRRTGWTAVDAYETRWGNNLGQLAVELADRYRSNGAGKSERRNL